MCVYVRARVYNDERITKAEQRWSTSSGGYDATGGVVPQSLSSARLWNYRCFAATTYTSHTTRLPLAAHHRPDTAFAPYPPARPHPHIYTRRSAPSPRHSIGGVARTSDSARRSAQSIVCRRCIRTRWARKNDEIRSNSVIASRRLQSFCT